ncbi:hypothetical protein [Jiangella asiatica]|uniref:Uncharacterized protein n=1 Tax=Jiangella asiatica TaxID=2530372 RepID=A0A4R5CY10_9ACTN|nr:hypothetical protein [Jiangella asiatica]TDE03424.1 hypothetical protein E1269_20515 [Jiangella asiatica]
MTPTIEPPVEPADPPLLCVDLEQVLDTCVNAPIVDDLLDDLLGADGPLLGGMVLGRVLYG